LGIRCGCGRGERCATPAELAQPPDRRLTLFRWVDRLPRATPARTGRWLWGTAIASLLVGLGGWGSDTLQGELIALWSFTLAAVTVAVVLPLAYALVSPLYMSAAGWLVDMLPFVVLAGWTAVAVRWALSLVRERRLPRGGRWTWLPIGLTFWTALGVVVITPPDLKHFLLLLGMQVIASAVLLAVVDRLTSAADRVALTQGLVGFVILLSGAVFLQWVGVPVDPLRDSDIRGRVEAAYGVDAFPNNIGMIKHARSVRHGAGDLAAAIEALRENVPAMPSFQVFRPKFQAYENSLVVRFDGSARAHEEQLRAEGVTLLYDNIGLAPANTVPRLRSFPRNALTFAGVCAGAFPFALFLAWTGDRRRRLLGRVGVVASLFGAAFSLARGAWLAILIGIAYLLVDAVVSKRLKVEALVAYVAAALVLTGVFLARYGVDPLSGRAGGGASVATREDLYQDTLGFLRGKHFFLGYGTEVPRTESGTVREGPGQRYVPRAGTHSTYLNYLFRTGLPGMLLMLSLYVIAWLHARAAARATEGEDGIFASAAAMAVVIVAAHAVILSLYVEPIYMLTISLILGVATASATGSTRSIILWRREGRSD